MQLNSAMVCGNLFKLYQLILVIYLVILLVILFHSLNEN